MNWLKLNSWSAKFLIGVAVFIVFGAGFKLGTYRLQQDQMILEMWSDQVEVSREAIVISAPVLVNSQLSFLVQPVDEKYYFKVNSFKSIDVSPGDKIVFSGQLKKIKKDDKSQSWLNYNYSQLIAGELILNQFRLLKPASRANFRRLIFTSQNYLNHLADQLLPYPHNILALGVLIGRDDFSAELKQIFRVAGISHITVLSGFNLSIAVNALYAIYSDRLRWGKAIVGAVVALFLTAISGFGGSALRALLMVMVAIYSKLSGRTYLAFRALLFAVVIISLWRPLMFLADIGFQLSALATLGLISLTEPLTLFFIKQQWPSWLSQLVGGTLAVEVMVIPWLSFKFGQVAIYGLIANVLVLPVVPILMIATFSLMVVGSFSSGLAYPFAWVSYLISTYIISTAGFVAAWPGAGFSLTFKPVFVWLWYFLIGGLFLYYRYWPTKNLLSQTI